MSRTVIVGDPHVDRNESTIDEKVELLDKILQIKCDRVIILGDVFNDRKHVSTIAVKKLQYLFSNSDKEIYIVVGNHDCRYRKTLSPNSIETSFNNIPNVIIVNKPVEIDDFLLIPWICEKNHLDCMNAIRTSKKKYCCGHFEISNFELHRGIKNLSGLKKSIFKHFEQVFSGHFHLRQQQSNIMYVGSLVQETWTDYEDKKGYYVVDNSEIKFYNDYSKEIYKYLTLSDNTIDFDIEDYKDCHIKVFHAEKLSKKQFNKIEDLKEKVLSYKVYDESVIIVNTKVDKVEFDVMVKEYMKDQEMDEIFKQAVIEYLILTNNLIKEK